MKRLILILSIAVLTIGCRTACINPSYVQIAYDDSIKTVSAISDCNQSTYPCQTIYKTRLDLVLNDRCIIKTKHGLSVGKIVKIHKDSVIGVRDCTKYGWITQKVNLEAIEAADNLDKQTVLKIKARMRKKVCERVIKVFGKNF